VDGVRGARRVARRLVVSDPRLHGVCRAALCWDRLELTYLVGKPIVAANLRQNASEADYRFALVRLRENSEAVGMIGGERDEKKVLTKYFGEVLGSTMGLMRTQRRLMWLTSFYATVGIVYPTLVASPPLFAGAITLGVLMQITAAFGHVQTSLNYFVDNFPRIAEWRSHVERLLEFEDALNSSGEATSESGEVTTIILSDCAAEEREEELDFENLQITTSEWQHHHRGHQYQDRQRRPRADCRAFGQRQEHAIPRDLRALAVGRWEDRGTR